MRSWWAAASAAVHFLHNISEVIYSNCWDKSWNKEADMPTHAKVFLAEDDAMIRMFACESLQENGHAVVAEAGTLQEALDTLPKLGSLMVDVAVVDGNLTKNDRSGKDGSTIASKIRSLFPSIKIIAWSGQPQTWGDLMLMKGSPVSELTGAVTGL